MIVAQSSGHPGNLHCSESVFKAVQGYHSIFTFEPATLITVKGFGDVLAYFLRSTTDVPPLELLKSLELTLNRDLIGYATREEICPYTFDLPKPKPPCVGPGGNEAMSTTSSCSSFVVKERYPIHPIAAGGDSSSHGTSPKAACSIHYPRSPAHPI